MYIYIEAEDMLQFTNHWYSIHPMDYLTEDHLDLLERQRLEREVIITESQINRYSSHLKELQAKLMKLKEALEPKVSEEETDDSKTVGG